MVEIYDTCMCSCRDSIHFGQSTFLHVYLSSLRLPFFKCSEMRAQFIFSVGYQAGPRFFSALNADSLPHWRNSSLYSDEDAVNYFSSYSPGIKTAKVPAPGPALAAALAEIDQFELEQAERIYLAYAELSGLMASMGTDQKPGQEFVQKWKQLAGMRKQFTILNTMMKNGTHWDEKFA